MKRKAELRKGHRTILFVSAHPDDTEIRASGFASLCREAGDRVVILSVTDGSSGHMNIEPIELAAIRRKEAENAVAVIGAESMCLNVRDGSLESSLKNRELMIRTIRKIAPDIIITNRLNDYHPDHRYTASLVQDSSYMLMVPNVVSDTPALGYNPIVMYWGDTFTFPGPFRPDVVISIDDVLEKKLDMMFAHTSQMFEWLPYVDNELDQVPPADDIAARHEWIRHMYNKRFVHHTSDCYRDMLISRYGKEKGESVKESEAFQVGEYGYYPTKEELELIFQGM